MARNGLRNENIVLLVCDEDKKWLGKIIMIRFWLPSLLGLELSRVEAFSSVPGLIKKDMLREFICKLKNRKAARPLSLVSIMINRFDKPWLW